ncbi:MAG: alpha/beta hydrolase [Streptosporangiaceae bacterium]|jgi:pimeloyl-ACP methyl ester carboxylesterase
MARWRRITGAAGLAAGAAAAGAGAVLAAERATIGRMRVKPDPAAAEPFGQLRGRSVTVLADDGVGLHTEINGPDDSPVTIVFCHGYTLNQDTWHYQRKYLAAVSRLVFWDQRGHGRSGSSSPEHVTIDQLGADLYAVLMATVPGDSPVVLVGHSMGGMTIMALADQHPELFGTKVIGAALISTAVSEIDPTVWLPGPLRSVARYAAPTVLRGAASGRGAPLIERSRHAASQIAFLSTRLIAFGDPAISPTVVDFLERIIRMTPIEVVTDFFHALLKHDKLTALRVLGQVPVVVVTGEKDRVVPLRQSEILAAEIPDAELLTVPGAGHVIILECPDLINEVIIDLVTRATEGRTRRDQSA